MRDEIKTILDRLTDVFSGADGGVSFVMLKNLIEALDKKAQEGDEDAEEVLTTTLRRFNKLLDISQNKP